MKNQIIKIGKNYSKCVENALKATKYKNPMTNEVWNLANRLTGPKMLHPEMAKIENFKVPNEKLEWIQLDNEELCIKNVREIWPKFRFSNKYFDFWRDLDFLPNIRFFNQYFDLADIWIFRPNFEFFLKILFPSKNFDFYQKHRFFPKTSIFTKKIDFSQKLRFFPKRDFWKTGHREFIILLSLNML